MAKLVDVLTGTQALTAEDVTSLLLERYAGDADDDVVLLVLRRSAG